MRLFFFGTLMDDEVRRLVVGRAVPVVPAAVAGFVRRFVAGRDYPMLLRRAGGRVKGVLTGPLEPDAIRRLRIYEGPEYRLQPIAVRRVPEGAVAAHAFLCPPHIVCAGRSWRFDDWRRRCKRAALIRIAAALRGIA